MIPSRRPPSFLLSSLLVSTALLCGVGCVQIQPGSKQDVPDPWVRADDGRPHEILRCYYGTQEQVDAMIEELGDVVLDRRWGARLGSGAVTVRFRDERKKRLPMVECGGRLLVVGTPGQAFQIEVENECDIAIEVLPGVDGLNLVSGDAWQSSEPGLILRPRGEHRFRARLGEGGEVEALIFSESRGVEALHLLPTDGVEGMVHLALFVPEGRETFEYNTPRKRDPVNREYDRERMRIPQQYR